MILQCVLVMINDIIIINEEMNYYSNDGNWWWYWYSMWYTIIINVCVCVCVIQ